MPDNYEYHRGLRASFGIDESDNCSPSTETLESLDEFYQAFAESHPGSLTCRRIPLDYKHGDAFVTATRNYVRGFILKGIPSLFSYLKPLYSDSVKAKALQKLFEGMAEGLTDTTGADPEMESNPQSILWIHLYLAQHYDIMGDTEMALNKVESAIAHTPTVPEIHDVHSKILKHAGDMEGAFEAADRGRKLDLADRYLNCIAVKACFRAGRIEEADDLAALFTKDEDQISNLVEMQCLWYEIACGNAHFKKSNYGKALKKYVAVSKHFDDFIEDQFDFHGYCIRKMTLRAYIDMLSMEDKIYSEASYGKAANGAIRCYLALHDNPELHKHPNAETPEIPAEPSKEKKKDTHKKGQPPPIKADPDPDGVELATVEAPLKQATKFVTTLRSYAPERLASQELGFEVYLRKQRLLLALSCVQRAIKIADRSHPTVHSMVVRLCKTVEEKGNCKEADKEDAASAVLDEGIKELLKGTTVMQYHRDYMTALPSDGILQHVTGAEMSVILDPEKRNHHLKLLMSSLKHRPSLKDCQAIHSYLLSPVLNATNEAEEWKRRCAEWYPRSSYFDGSAATRRDTGR